MNWRRGLTRIWLVATTLWVAFNVVGLIGNGGFDFSDRSLKFTVAGEEFHAIIDEDDAAIKARIVTMSSERARSDNQGIAAHCAVATAARANKTKPAGDIRKSNDEEPDPWESLGIIPECLPSSGLLNSMIEGPLYEARIKAGWPLRTVWRDFLYLGLVPPAGIIILGWLVGWVLNGFRASNR